MAFPNSNRIVPLRDALIMYVDMNSYFASCEQQLQESLRNRPVGVCAYVSENAVILAASIQAKRFGAKTGMRVWECKLLCPEMVFVPTRAVHYRRFHVEIMKVLHAYCDEIFPKSIDEAVMNLTAYKYLYKDVLALGRKIKQDIAIKVGECLTCSIGIAGNAFLAKLATEMQKPDGLIQITPDNIDRHLSKLKLIDLPGIGKANERRLKTVGINTPLELRNASESVLRKTFGGVVGNYWYSRMHFGEVDLYSSAYKTMSVMRSISKEIRAQQKTLLALLNTMCTRLEQRLVKQRIFCRDIHFYAHYYNAFVWETAVSLKQPVQDGMEIMQQIMQRVKVYETQTKYTLFNNSMKSMNIVVSNFVNDTLIQYTLFDNVLEKNLLRRTVYQIKDRFGKNSVRKASEIIQTGTMRDAIGFGSVKDLYNLNSTEENKTYLNQYMLEEDEEM